MTVDPFIEAEEVAGHSVNNACRLLEVSKSAYYQRRNGVPSARTLNDAELIEKITAIHAESKGTYGAPRIHKEFLHRHVACGKRKVTRLMRQAGLEGRCKKRWRKTTTGTGKPACSARYWDVAQLGWGNLGAALLDPFTSHRTRFGRLVQRHRSGDQCRAGSRGSVFRCSVSDGPTAGAAVPREAARSVQMSSTSRLRFDTAAAPMSVVITAMPPLVTLNPSTAPTTAPTPAAPMPLARIAFGVSVRTQPA